jgi:hypothetical protein
VHAVINGEIYDHDRLRDELSRSGYTFKGKSDSEVAVALYQRYGAPRFLEHCRGEFAMVIYDDRSGEVWALRDRMGIKPLFWTIVGNELLIASEMKAFLPVGWKPEWDVESIALGRTEHGRWTLFKDVYRVGEFFSFSFFLFLFFFFFFPNVLEYILKGAVLGRARLLHERHSRWCHHALSILGPGLSQQGRKELLRRNCLRQTSF